MCAFPVTGQAPLGCSCMSGWPAGSVDVVENELLVDIEASMRTKLGDWMKPRGVCLDEGSNSNWITASPFIRTREEEKHKAKASRKDAKANGQV